MKEKDTSDTTGPGSPVINFIVTFFAVTLTCFSIARAFDIDRMLGLVLYTEQYLGIMLTVSLPLVYLAVPAGKGRERKGKVPWYDGVAAFIAFFASAYTAIRYPVLTEFITVRPVDGIVVGSIMLVLLTEGLRRTTGNALTTVVVAFFIYALLGDMIPGMLQGRPVKLSKLVYYLSWDSSAVLGIGLRIVTSIVVAFVLFGQVLFKTGGSVWFTEFATVLMGRFRGGPAKVSVFASSIFGTISGSSVSNVVTTGVITIPLMRNGGYPAHLAGAIEAVASTGGQLMPPVMGAAAFLMAEFLAISYTEVILAALIPAILYYVALFIQADLEAARSGIARIDKSLIPPAWAVIKSGWFFPLPFAVLLFALFWLNDLPEKAALRAVAVIVVLSLLFGYKGKRMKWFDLFDSLRSTGIAVLSIFMIGAAVGLVIGVLNLSGLGFAMTLSLVQIAGGNLIILLVMAAVTCIILGMGMPTLGVYVLLATLVAPALEEFGVLPIAAHLFIQYFGMLSFITPPVAIAAFAAATLTNADPMRTGFAAMRFGWLAFVIPFMFVLSPTLIMIGHPLLVIVDLITALAGTWLVSVGMIGYLFRPLSILKRMISIAAGIALISPTTGFKTAIIVNLSGLAVGIMLIAWEIISRRRIQMA